MKILSLVTEAFGGHGGIAEFNRNLISAICLDPENHVTVLPVNKCEFTGPIPAGVKLLKSPDNRFLYGLSAFAICFKESFKFDLVFCGHLHLTPVAAALNYLTGIPFWTQLHGIEAWSKRNSLIGGASRRAAIITSVSKFTRDRFCSWANVSERDVMILPNTFDEQRFCPGPFPHRLAAQLGVDQRRVILTVSRLAASERYKGHDRILPILPDLLKRHPDLIYLVVGDGDDRERLENRSRELGVQDNVRFVGHVSERDLPDFYRLARAYIMPSTGEGFGIVFLEALACGTPVVAGDADGSPEALLGGRLGIVVDPADPDEIRSAIEEALLKEKGVSEELRFFRRASFDHRIMEIIDRFKENQSVPMASI